jgi:hypothetical protein
MIDVKCDTKHTALLTEMTPFQGDLKKRTPKDIDALVTSLQSEGLLMPFALWQNDDKLMILDGHGRYAALSKIAFNDITVLTQPLPVLLIDAVDENEARKVLLQIVSTYGKISKSGVTKFAAPLIDYKAPIITKVNKVIMHERIKDDCVIVKLKIKKVMVDKLIELLKGVDGVEVV